MARFRRLTPSTPQVSARSNPGGERPWVLPGNERHEGAIVRSRSAIVPGGPAAWVLPGNERHESAILRLPVSRRARKTRRVSAAR